jgi:hypothetical protein
VSGGDTQQRPPPPPPPNTTSGSPFGRFLTSPVLLVGVIALVLGFAALRYVGAEDADVGHPAPEPTGIEGTWVSEVPSDAHVPDAVRLHIATDGTGRMTRGRCSGTLAPTTTMSSAAVFEYTETSGERGCPRRTQVTVTLEDGALRFEERGRGGRLIAAGTLPRD